MSQENTQMMAGQDLLASGKGGSELTDGECAALMREFNLDEGFLDEIVLDLFSVRGSDTNNGGMPEQLRVISKERSNADVAEEIREMFKVSWHEAKNCLDEERFDDLARLIEEKDGTCEDLDDMVHDVFANEACVVNRYGIYRQIRFLVDTLGAEQTVRAFQDG